MKGPWCKLPYAVINDPTLMPTAKLVYAAIAYRIGNNSCCWPGMRRLASDTCLHRNSIARSIEELESAGYLQVKRRGNGQSNLYRLAERHNKSVTKKQPPPSNRHKYGGSGGHAIVTDASPLEGHNYIKIDKLNTSASAGFGEAAAADETDQSVVLTGDWADQIGQEIDPDSKDFLDWFGQTYKQKTGQDYQLDCSRELALAKDLLDKLDLERLKRAATNMSNHPVWGKRSPCISLLSFKLSDWLNDSGDFAQNGIAP